MVTTRVGFGAKPNEGGSAPFRANSTASCLKLGHELVEGRALGHHGKLEALRDPAGLLTRAHGGLDRMLQPTSLRAVSIRRAPPGNRRPSSAKNATDGRVDH